MKNRTSNKNDNARHLKKVSEAVEISHNLVVEVIDKSEPNIKRHLKTKFRPIQDIYFENKEIEDKSTMINAIHEIAKKDFLLFCLWYFPHWFFNGFSRWQITDYIEPCGEIVNPECQFDKLFLTGYRGSGKSTIQMIHQSWMICTKQTLCTANVAYDIDKALNNMADMILLFAHSFPAKFNHSDGTTRDSLYALLFSDLVLNLELIRGFSGHKDKQAMDIYKKFTKQSVNSYFDLANGVRIFPISARSGKLRGLTGNSPEARLRGIYFDDVEDESMLGGEVQEKIWKIFGAGFNAATNMQDKPQFTITSGNFFSTEGNIQKFFDWSNDPDKKTKFISIDIINEAEKTSNVLYETFAQSMARVKASDDPQELRNDPSAGLISVVDTDKISFVDESLLREEHTVRILSVDGAYAGTKYGDDGAVSELTIDIFGKYYWGGTNLGKCTTRQLINYVLDKIQTYKPNYIIMETNGNQCIFEQWFKEEVQKIYGHNKPFFTIFIKQKGSKADRIQAFLPSLMEDTTFLIRERSEDLMKTIRSCTEKKLKKMRKSERSRSLGLDMLDSMEQAFAWVQQVGVQSLKPHTWERVEEEHIDTRMKW